MRTFNVASKQYILALAVLLLIMLAGQAASAHSASYTNYSPTKGYVSGYHNSSGWLAGYRSVDSWVRWETTSSCNTSSALYTFCSGAHRVFEHNVEMSDYRSAYPSEYRYAKWPEGYYSNYPGTSYLDTQASDSNMESFTVGTLDGNQFQTYVTYYANIIGTPDYPGPNWWQLRFEVGNKDSPGCGVTVSPPWCMLYPHSGNRRIPLSWHNAFPGGLYWYYQGNY